MIPARIISLTVRGSEGIKWPIVTRGMCGSESWEDYLLSILLASLPDADDLTGILCAGGVILVEMVGRLINFIFAFVKIYCVAVLMLGISTIDRMYELHTRGGDEAMTRTR